MALRASNFFPDAFELQGGTNGHLSENYESIFETNFRKPMIKSQLLPSRIPAECAATVYRAIMRDGRGAIAAQMLAARKRASSYARRLRAKGYSAGYEDGIRAARRDCEHALLQLRKAYSDAIAVATGDVQSLTYQLAEKLVDRAFLEKPEVLLSWLERALTLLKRSRALSIHYHPRYEHIMKLISSYLPPAVSSVSSDTLGELDFRIEGERGGVACSVRDALVEYSRQHPTMQACSYGSYERT